MSRQDIIRAWKDEGYRNSLSEEARAQLPENPAGLIELPDGDLGDVAGGTNPLVVYGIAYATVVYCEVAFMAGGAVAGGIATYVKDCY